MKSISLLTLLSALTLTSAHGIVQNLIIGATTYPGNNAENANDPKVDSVIREVITQNPVKGAMSVDMNCGASSKPAALVANVMPGDMMRFNWMGAYGNNWVHDTGPMMNYLASCGDQTCDKFDSTQAKWFKISQDGRQSSGGLWMQALVKAGGTANVTIPSNIKPGNYLMRHELIAIHNGQTMGGAEFYPSCTQLNIGGSGTGVPSNSELVSFPGAYQDSDPGIFDQNAYDPSAAYTFPGPPVAAFVGGASSGSSGSDSGAAASSMSTMMATSTSPAGAAASAPPTSTASSSSSMNTGTSSQCKLKRRVPTNGTAGLSKRSNAYLVESVKRHARPRRLSRIMRDLKVGSNGLFH